MPETIAGGGHPILLLEKFDEMRRIGKSTFVADLRHRLRCRKQQQPRVDQSLANIPFMGRHLEDIPKLLFERCQRTMREPSQLLDTDILENMVKDHLLETLFGGINIAQQFAFDAAIFMCNDQIDQLGHFDILGRLVVMKVFVTQITVGIGKEVAQRTPSGHGNMSERIFLVLYTIVRDTQLVSDVQMQQDPLKICRTVKEKNLFEGLTSFGAILDIVMAQAEIENIAARQRLAFIPIVNVFRAPQYIANGVARQHLRLNTVVKRFNILHDHRLLHRRMKRIAHVCV